MSPLPEWTDRLGLGLGVARAVCLGQVDLDVAGDGVEVEQGGDPGGDPDADVTGAGLGPDAAAVHGAQRDVARAGHDLEVAHGCADGHVARAGLGQHVALGPAHRHVTAARHEVGAAVGGLELDVARAGLGPSLALHRAGGEVARAGLQIGRGQVVEGDVARAGARLRGAEAALADDVAGSGLELEGAARGELDLDVDGVALEGEHRALLRREHDDGVAARLDREALGELAPVLAARHEPDDGRACPRSRAG